MSDWMKQYKEEQDKHNQTIEQATKTILDAIKGVDRVSCLPTILANLFEATDNENETIHNQMVNWATETYVGRKLSKLIPNLEILYNFCKEKEYTQDNTWEWGSGDRTVCYIPNENKQILLFENQNIQFVVVFAGYQVHVREVFKSIYNQEYFYGYEGTGFSNVDELRQGLKQDNGLEIAICNLTGKYTRYSNSVEGNQYPDRIDLENMKHNNFDKNSKAFTYGDNRDCGYIFSTYKNNSILGEKCEINDINKASYVFNDMTGATNEIPKKYIKAFKRDAKLNELLD